MEDVVNDSRFSHITKDPRFKRIPKWEKKIKIDKRFHSMFKDKQFKLNYAVDKRGRPVIKSSNEDLKKYYALSSSSDDEDDDDDNDNESDDGDSGTIEAEGPISSQEKLDFEKKENSSRDRTKLKKSKLNKDQIDSLENEESFGESYNEEKGLTKSVKEKLRDLTVDYARGGGVLFSDSSSEEESSEVESEEEGLDHGWGELDRDAERTDEITNRLALCHMDWDRIRAVDLMVLFNSFLPQGGFLQTVTIYPSEFGLKRMKEEEVKGPLELVDKTNDEEDETNDENKNENEEGSAYSMEKLRQYQLNRLKYFYAVLVFDSPQTANKVYMECDGMEYESSATRLDLRFVPDDTTFDQEPREICNKLPDPSKYQPRYFTTTALQQAKVDLTWDETNPEREELNKKLMSGQVDGISEADLRDYLATSSEDESGESEKEDKSEHKKETTNDPVSKYRSLLQEIEENEEKKKNNEVEMEITWGVGLKEKTEKLVQKKLKEKQNELTPFEQFLEKKKEKKIRRKEERKKKAKQETTESDNMFSDDDIPSDVDMNDPYFKEELQGNVNKKENKIKKKKDANDSIEELQQEQAELELLLMNDAEEKNHFSLKSIQEHESEGKKKLKKKKKKKQNSTEEKTEDFEVNVKDERFSALYSSHLFNIDPTDPHYRKTKGMEALRAEKISYRQQNQTNLVPAKRHKIDSQHNQDPELSVLVKTVKRKAQNLQRAGR